MKKLFGIAISIAMLAALFVFSVSAEGENLALNADYLLLEQKPETWVIEATKDKSVVLTDGVRAGSEGMAAGSKSVGIWANATAVKGSNDEVKRDPIVIDDVGCSLVVVDLGKTTYVSSFVAEFVVSTSWGIGIPDVSIYVLDTDFDSLSIETTGVELIKDETAVGQASTKKISTFDGYVETDDNKLDGVHEATLSLDEAVSGSVVVFALKHTSKDWVFMSEVEVYAGKAPTTDTSSQTDSSSDESTDTQASSQTGASSQTDVSSAASSTGTGGTKPGENSAVALYIVFAAIAVGAAVFALAKKRKA